MTQNILITLSLLFLWFIHCMNMWQLCCFSMFIFVSLLQVSFWCFQQKHTTSRREGITIQWNVCILYFCIPPWHIQCNSFCAKLLGMILGELVAIQLWNMGSCSFSSLLNTPKIRFLGELASREEFHTAQMPIILWKIGSLQTNIKMK